MHVSFYLLDNTAAGVVTRRSAESTELIDEI